MQKAWKKIIISELNKDPEYLLPAIYEFNSLGLEQKENSLEIYFSADLNLDDLQTRLQKDMQAYMIQGKITTHTLKNEKWHLTWKKDFRPVKISDRISIIPAWLQAEEESEILLKINPGMAFGTGTHPTTQMALQLIEQYLGTDYRILDAGCGSGILTVAALKLGAKSVEAWDITDDVKENFQEHMEINNIETGYSLKIGDVTNLTNYNYDLILSNIQKNINVKVLESTSRAGYGGLIIFTGILKSEKKEFKAILSKHNRDVIRVLEKGEWIAFVVK